MSDNHNGEQYGFELLSQESVPELSSHAYLFRHTKTGAEVLSIVNQDENKCFGINFATPRNDSTGVAHIMEHSVLCGSKKYPIKEPFVELLKSSVKTFLNAMTYPDKTVYPVASQNEKDFHNLMSVYLDAVFAPVISEEIFQQEGWHYEWKEETGELIYKGVVFNEMKGANTPERSLYTARKKALFPDTPYAWDSGGEPARILDLTYEDFKQFHADHYHPSNSRAFFWGDDTPEERLKRVAEYFDQFEKRDLDYELPVQKRFTEPKRIEMPFAVGEESDPEKEAMVIVSWLLSDDKSADVALEFTVLNQLLLGTAGAPMKKALIESGLGQALAGGGVDQSIRESSFTIGLKGTSLDSVDKIESLIIETLEHHSKEGFSDDAMAAALNTIEFRLRELNTGSYPRGLVVMEEVVEAWLYGFDPIQALFFEKSMKTLRAKIDSGEKLFEEIIKTYFLDNNHRVTLAMRPDKSLLKELDKEEHARIETFQKGLDESAKNELKAKEASLKVWQSTPDSREALATIPVLALSDLSRAHTVIPDKACEIEKAQYRYHELPTNGIVYTDVAFDFRAVPVKLLPLLNFYTDILFQMGTEDESYEAFSERIARDTGGVWVSSLSLEPSGTDQQIYKMVLRGKAIGEKVPALYSIFSDAIHKGRLDNKERFKQLLLQQKVGLERSLIPSGHSYVARRIGAHRSVPGWIDEQMGGIDYLLWLRKLEKRVEEDWAGVLTELNTVRSKLFDRGLTIANITADSDLLSVTEGEYRKLYETLPDGGLRFNQKWKVGEYDNFEALIVPSQVNFVGQGINLYESGYEYHGSSMVLTRLLNTSYFWEKIRVEGGAYGGGCSFDRFTGLMKFYSYRDPNLEATLGIYERVAEYIASLELSPEELEKSVIGAIGSLDSYRFADSKGWDSFVQFLTGQEDAFFQKRRDEVFETTLEHFKSFGEAVSKGLENRTVAVIGGAEAVSQAEANSALRFSVRPIL